MLGVDDTKAASIVQEIVCAYVLEDPVFRVVAYCYSHRFSSNWVEYRFSWSHCADRCWLVQKNIKSRFRLVNNINALNLFLKPSLPYI